LSTVEQRQREYDNSCRDVVLDALVPMYLKMMIMIIHNFSSTAMATATKMMMIVALSVVVPWRIVLMTMFAVALYPRERQQQR
jgi:hypothetical protein